MTNPTDRDDTGRPDDREDAELVSAVLDGVASPAEVDRVMGDPALHDQLEAYRAVSGALANPAEPLTAATVDHVVDRALEEFDLGDTDVDAEGNTNEPVPVNWTGELPQWSDHQGPGRVVNDRRRTPAHDRRPTNRDRRRRRVPPLAIAAALVLLAGLGLFLALSARSTNHTKAGPAATGAPGSSTTNKAGARARQNAPPTSASPGNGAGASPGGVDETGVRFVGRFAGDSDLSTALSTLNPRTLQGPAVGTPNAKPYVPSATEITRCDPVVRGHISRALTNRLAVAGATSANRDLIVFSYEAPASNGQPAGVLIIAASRTSCYPMLSQFH